MWFKTVYNLAFQEGIFYLEEKLFKPKIWNEAISVFKK